VELAGLAIPELVPGVSWSESHEDPGDSCFAAVVEEVLLKSSYSLILLMNEWLNAIMGGKPSTSQCHTTTQKRIYYKIKYKINHFYLFQKILLFYLNI